jgi:hypothetical protein
MFKLFQHWNSRQGSAVRHHSGTRLSDREALAKLAELLEASEVTILTPGKVRFRTESPRGVMVTELTDYAPRIYPLVRVVQAYLAIQEANGDELAQANLARLRDPGANSVYVDEWSGGLPLQYPSISVPADGNWPGSCAVQPLRCAFVLGFIGNAPGRLGLEDGIPFSTLEKFLDELLEAYHNEQSHQMRMSV